MGSRLAPVAIIIAIPCVALAAADIPTRYSGSFPSVGNAINVSGTFTGNALSLNYSVKREDRVLPVVGNYSCRNKSSNATRCDGSWRVVSSGITGPGGVDITWKAGKPAGFHIDKPHR
jgi:hypothetical protein